MQTDEKHPQIQNAKTGVLLLNLGTPDATDYWSVRRYLSEFLSDKRVVDYPSIFWQPLLQGIILARRPFKTGKLYREVWDKERNESPLRTYTRSQSEKVAATLQDKYPNVVFDWAMRYGNPSTKSGIERLQEQGCQRIVLFALYPQYSATTTGSAYDKAFEYLQNANWQPAIRTAQAWHDDPAYIDLLAQSIEAGIAGAKDKPDHIIATFHGLPVRYLKEGDPYHCFCQKTSRLVQEKLGWDKDKWSCTFQSRFGPEEWLQPYTDERIAELTQKGVKNLAIFSPSFVSDCLETLEEVNMGLREEFLEQGGETFTYIPCLNDTDAHIDFLAARIERELMGWV